jgi:hypothetical protein
MNIAEEQEPNLEERRASWDAFMALLLPVSKPLPASSWEKWSGTLSRRVSDPPTKPNDEPDADTPHIVDRPS